MGVAVGDNTVNQDVPSDLIQSSGHQSADRVTGGGSSFHIKIVDHTVGSHGAQNNEIK